MKKKIKIKIKYYLMGLITLVLTAMSLQVSANYIAKALNTHTIHFSDNKTHTLLTTEAFHGAAMSAAGGAQLIVVLFNAECNVDAKKAGVWVGIEVQTRSLLFNDSRIPRQWSEWRTTGASGNNHALCSSHGRDTPVVRVSTSIHKTVYYGDHAEDSMHQVRVQGTLRDGTGTASIDDSSLIIIN